MADSYAYGTRRKNIPRRIVFIMIFVILLAVAGLLAARHLYYQGLGPVSSSQETQIVTIETGSSSKQIGELLEQKQLIRSAWAFELYIHSKDLGDKLQAGTYALSPNLGTADIIGTLTKGQVTSTLVTI